MDLQLGFFASHRGSNLAAILTAIENGDLDAQAKVLICNNQNAPVLDLALKKNIPAYCLNQQDPEQRDEAILALLRDHGVNLVVLAGYVQKVGQQIISTYSNRIINIHPALLPKYGGKRMYGLRVHQAVINSPDMESGATVHLVTAEYDEGRILAQYKVPRHARDTAETLAERVLRVEHVLYPQTLRDIQRGIILLEE